MTGDHGQDGDRRPPDGPRPRPDFLPPVPPPEPAAPDEPIEPVGPVEPVEPAAAVGAPAPRARASAAPAWAAARLLTAVVLLVSPFLPWARMRIRLEGFGATLDDDLVSVAGVNLDGTAQVVPVLAVIAIVMLGWGLLAADHRIGALAAVPAGLSLLACLIFVLRMERIRTEYGPPRRWPVGLELTADYGWYLSLAAALLLVGLALARR
ncbi:hypothetical protein [Thermomonospora amylolytica]|uniref:hypothetical protein n=1 Tax=Thermomonospora amylolytica TaxID=1411117 RepID=UPI000E6BC240|nr:hypothetical protein [Thermomonospora amylolytica]